MLFFRLPIHVKVLDKKAQKKLEARDTSEEQKNTPEPKGISVEDPLFHPGSIW
jgi:hypothetical protein